MPVPVMILLAIVTVLTIVLPVMAMRAYRAGALNDSALSLSWAPLAAWIISTVVEFMSGQPPSRSAAATGGFLNLCGVAAALVLALTKGAPKPLKVIAWICVVGILARAGYEIWASLSMLP